MPQIEQSDADIAQLALEQLLTDTGGEGDIAYVYVAGFAPLDRRNAVFQEVLAANPGLKNVATFGTVSDSTAAEVQTQAAAVLPANPDIKAIFAPYDEFAKGAVLAIEAAGLQDPVKVYGADISAADIGVITAENSPWVATVGTDPANVGRVAVRAAALAAAGEAVDPQIVVNPALITQQFLGDNAITTIAELGPQLPTLDTPDILPAPWLGRSASDLRPPGRRGPPRGVRARGRAPRAAQAVRGHPAPGRHRPRAVGRRGPRPGRRQRGRQVHAHPDALRRHPARRGPRPHRGRDARSATPPFAPRPGSRRCTRRSTPGSCPVTPSPRTSPSTASAAAPRARLPARSDGAGAASRTALDLDLPLDAPIERVGASDRQRILICRALARDPRLLILDEPTSALSQREAQLLFATSGAWRAGCGRALHLAPAGRGRRSRGPRERAARRAPRP